MGLKPLKPGPDAPPSVLKQYEADLADMETHPENWGLAPEQTPSGFTRAVNHAKRNPEMWKSGTVDMQQFGSNIDPDLVMRDAGIKLLTPAEEKAKEVQVERGRGQGDGPPIPAAALPEPIKPNPNPVGKK